MNMANNATFFDQTQTVVIKTNNRCNLNCSYCYEEFNQNIPRPSLTVESYRKMQDELVTYSKRRRINHLNIIWHGGEPLLIGMDFYKSVLTQQKQCDIRFSNLMQTNATLITNQWIDFFKENDFKIGISLDGNPESNKVHRQKTELVIRNLELLNNQGIRPSIICVVSDQNYMHYSQLFSFFKNYQVEYIDLVPCYENNGKFTLNEENYQTFFTQMFDLWIENGMTPIIRPFLNMIELLSGKVERDQLITCSLTGRCGEIISISPTGDVFFCDCLPKEPQNMIGNILCTDIYHLSKSTNYTKLDKFKYAVSEDCLSCIYRNACGTGCMTRRISNGGKDYYCHARKSLFSHICKSLKITPKSIDFSPIPAFTRGPQPIVK